MVERRSIFKDCATFSNYVGYVRKDYHFSELPLTWDTPAVANVVASLKLTALVKFRFPNFITSDTVSRTIHVGTMDGDFAQLAYVAFLYALRVPSESLPPKRAFPNGDLLGLSL